MPNNTPLAMMQTYMQCQAKKDPFKECDTINKDMSAKPNSKRQFPFMQFLCWARNIRQWWKRPRQ
jgi:hypothetical protein